MAAMEARIDGVTGTVNSWIVGDDEEVIVIDPGDDAAAVLDAVGEREIVAVICTHGHAGAHRRRAGGRGAGRGAGGAAPGRYRHWREAHSGDDPEIEMADGGMFEVADVSLEVMHAPGHSPGSVCLYCEDLDVVFTGDVLTADGPVPHDDEFPDFSRQLSSIGAEVLTLPSPTRVLPGHGEEFTVGAAEKRFDSWVTGGPGGSVAGDPA